MIVNRNNYEEYFILYLDNELDAASRREVEDFIERNPDLKEELELLSQFKLSPDPIVFPGKAGLLKNETNRLVNADNYKEWLLLYVDNELTAAQKQQVMLFIENHPAVQKELELFEQARLEPETIVYPGKEKLYHSETRVRRIYWWRIAAAATLILATGSFFLSRMNKSETSVTPEIVVYKEPVKQQPNSVTVNDDPNPVVVNQTVEKSPVTVKATNNNQQPKEKKVYQPGIENNRQPAIARNEIIKSNNLPQPEYNPNTKEVEANIVTLNKNPKVIPDEFKSNQNVTPGITYTSNNETGTTGNEEVFNEESGKKSKFRGFLRKVTRTIEKTTNIDATDDEDRLLIGGLAIKLK